ncbi:MAG TPA: flagellin [Terracidiphilus sp.]|jgi:flagellin
MSLGVLNNLSAMYASNNLNNTQNSLTKTLQELSSGSKINSGADDAAGLSLVNGLQANSQALTQSKTNAQEGVGLLQVADGALSQVTNLLNRAVTLATEVSNGTLNSSQQSAANQEYQSILSEISNIGSTTTYNQKQVFNSSTDIYVGDSSTAGASVDSLNINSLSSANVGDSNGTMGYSNGQSNVFIDLSKGGTNAALTDSLTGGVTGSTTITVGYMSTSSNGTSSPATATITVGGTNSTYANTTQGLISAINNSGLGLNATFGTAAQAGTAAVSNAQASVGGKGGATDTGIIITAANIGANTAGTNGVGEVGTLTVTSDSNVDADANKMSGSLNIVGSDGKSHIVQLGTAGKTDTLANLATTINGAGYGVTAAYTASVGTTAANIVFNTSNPAVSVTAGTTLGGSGTGFSATTLTGTPTTNATQSSVIGTLSLANADQAKAGFQLSGHLVIDGNNFNTTESGSSAYTTLASDINAANLGVTAAYDSTSGKMTFTSINSAATVTSGTMADTDGVGPGDVTAIPAVVTAGDTTSSNFYSIGISGTVSDTSTSGGGTTNTGIVADSNGSGGAAKITYSHGAGVALSSTDLTNQTDAQAALTTLNSAISAVSAQDGYIGAQINTLNAVSSVLSTQQQNVVAAQNAVQATDYATAASNMSKYQILSQTGISALAQANSMQQEVTKLLQ